jgi:hypothetical protein
MRWGRFRVFCGVEIVLEWLSAILFFLQLLVAVPGGSF